MPLPFLKNLLPRLRELSKQVVLKPAPILGIFHRHSPEGACLLGDSWVRVACSPGL